MSDRNLDTFDVHMVVVQTSVVHATEDQVRQYIQDALEEDFVIKEIRVASLEEPLKE